MERVVLGRVVQHSAFLPSPMCFPFVVLTLLVVFSWRPVWWRPRFYEKAQRSAPKRKKRTRRRQHKTGPAWYFLFDIQRMVGADALPDSPPSSLCSSIPSNLVAASKTSRQWQSASHFMRHFLAPAERDGASACNHPLTSEQANHMAKEQHGEMKSFGMDKVENGF